MQAQVVKKLQGYMWCYSIVPTRVIWLFKEGQQVTITDMDWTGPPLTRVESSDFEATSKKRDLPPTERDCEVHADMLSRYADISSMQIC